MLTNEDIHQNPRPTRPLPTHPTPRPRPSGPRVVLEIVLAAWAGMILLGSIGDFVYMQAGHPRVLNTPAVNVGWMIVSLAVGALAWSAHRGWLSRTSRSGRSRT